ncbi:MAG: RluA family pseudouridine synthase [Anaerolineaceae bacterium]|nr:RluA family pseudouridine synthase [Anaerolineaceae bacterium]
MPDFTRSRLQGLIRDGFVAINGEVVLKTGFTVEAGDQINVRVPHPEPADLIPQNIPLEIVFENKDLMVVNKSAGMVVHPALGHATGTLVNAALAHIPDLEGIGGELRPGIVHRLDKDTSGLIILAKNERAHQFLQNQFKARKVKKIYLTLVEGSPPTPEGRIEAFIGRDSTHRKKMTIVPESKGREAVSEYYTLEKFSQHTLLEVHPLTGRTHQIRIHMAFLDCPVAGDTLYGRRRPSVEINRQFLHAGRLTIRIPGGEERTFEAPLPEELESVLAFLRRH